MESGLEYREMVLLKTSNFTFNVSSQENFWHTPCTYITETRELHYS